MTAGSGHQVPLDGLPGYRRKFRFTPLPGRIIAELEDDFHCMAVTVFHDGTLATNVVADMRRVPWTTCPGAQVELSNTFNGLPLSEFGRQGGKKTSNCTHLFDLATFAAEHATDDKPSNYDILVSDVENNERQAEIRLNGEKQLSWREREFVLVAPENLAGQHLMELGQWISTLEAPEKRAAKMLRWGNMVANGRSIPLNEQSDATRMPPNCYTFQPERAVEAKRVGLIRDFSEDNTQPLADYPPETE